MQNQINLTNFCPQKNITQKKKVFVKEVNYSNDDVLVNDK